MAVKGSSTAARVLSVFEAVATHQPVGVATLSRMLGADKSAVQRALVTLAEHGWIRVPEGPLTQWEITPRILTIANSPRARTDLRHTARLVLEQLADDTGETAIFNEPDGARLVVSLMVESPHPLRMAPRIGTIIPVEHSATGRVLLPYLSRDRQAELLCRAPDDALLAQFRQTRVAGIALSSDVNAGALTIAAPVFEVGGRPVGVVAVTAPIDRVPANRQPCLIEQVREAARLLSRGVPDAAQVP